MWSCMSSFPGEDMMLPIYSEMYLLQYESRVEPRRHLHDLEKNCLLYDLNLQVD